MLRLGRFLTFRIKVPEALPVKKPILEITESSTRQIQYMMGDSPAAGIRLDIKQRGCSGYKYELYFADEINPDDAIFDVGAKILVDRKILPAIKGTKIDYVDTDIESKFVFTNSNAQSCGCGESFSLGDVQPGMRGCSRQ
jgi:iron-sulfur cluster assembly accessory protein